MPLIATEITVRRQGGFQHGSPRPVRMSPSSSDMAGAITMISFALIRTGVVTTPVGSVPFSSGSSPSVAKSTRTWAGLGLGVGVP